MNTVKRLVTSSTVALAISACGSAPKNENAELIAVLSHQIIVDGHIICLYTAIVTDDVAKFLSVNSFTVSTNISNSDKSVLFISQHEISTTLVNLPVDVKPHSQLELTVMYPLTAVVYELPIIRFQPVTVDQ